MKKPGANRTKTGMELLDKRSSLEELTLLIRKAYRQLAELGFKYWGTHQTVDDTKRRIANGECYVKKAKGRLVGTIFLSNPDKIHDHDYYNQTHVTPFSQFAVDPDFQRSGIGGELMDLVEKRAIQLGAKELACDTAEGATHLISMYRKRGYRIVEKADWDITNYVSVIMSKRLTE